jgi:hydroxymethylpyrimidine/phosphomethylpyrimidine kinase
MTEKKNKTIELYPSALTIAGSDSGGGAGIQADLRTFNAYGVYGCSAITAVTSQNPLEVTGIVNIPAAEVARQIDTVLREIPVKFAKSGMLPDADCIAAVADAVTRYRFELVCDPVMVSTSGSVLQKKEAVAVLKKELLPKTGWVTPNVPEAEMLLGKKITTPDAQKDAARELFEKFGCNVLLKGGHLSCRKTALDAVCFKGELLVLKSPAVDLDTVSESHGSGCTLSAALTAGFAMGMSWQNALLDAKAFVLGSMRETAQIGQDIFAMYPPTMDCTGEVALLKEKPRKSAK